MTPATLISISLSTLLFLLEASAMLLTWFSSYFAGVSFSGTLLLLLLPLTPINVEVNILAIYSYKETTPKLGGPKQIFIISYNSLVDQDILLLPVMSPGGAVTLERSRMASLPWLAVGADCHLGHLHVAPWVSSQHGS